MHENLGSLREERGIEIDALGLMLNLDPEAVLALEEDPLEALEVLELQQWAQWATLLDLPLIELLALLQLCPTGTVTPMTFRELRDALGEVAAKGGGLEKIEELTGWELGDFIRDPEDGWSRKLPFFQAVSRVSGRDWRGIAAAYGVPV